MAATYPTELLTNIFQQSTKLDPSAIGSISGVCRNWRSIAFDLPDLWMTLVLDGSRKTRPVALIHKIKLWLTRRPSNRLDITLIYGQIFDMVLPMVSYIITASSRCSSVALQPSAAETPQLWFDRPITGYPVRRFERMQLMLGVQCIATTSAHHSRDGPRFRMEKFTGPCLEGSNLRTFALHLPINSIRTNIIFPFSHVKSLHLACDPSNEGSSCQRVINILAAFPNLESLHLWNNHSSLELSPHVNSRLHFPKLLHICVSQTFVCTLSHILAPNLEFFYLRQFTHTEDNKHIPTIAGRIPLEDHQDGNISDSHSAPGLVLRMLLMECSPCLKVLDIRHLTALETMWVVDNINTIEVLDLTESSIPEEAILRITPGADGRCRLPRLRELRLTNVTGFALRSLHDMIRSRADRASLDEGISRIRTLLIMTCCLPENSWDLQPEWEQMREMLGSGLVFGRFDPPPHGE